MGSLVLIVDEDDLERRYIAALLAGDGFDVMQFSQTVEGMAATTAVEPSLVMLAFGSRLAPASGNIGISELVRVFRRITNAPLAIIGDARLDDEIESLACGGDLFLARGFGASELISRSRMLVRREGDSSVVEKSHSDGRGCRSSNGAV